MEPFKPQVNTHLEDMTKSESQLAFYMDSGLSFQFRKNTASFSMNACDFYSGAVYTKRRKRLRARTAEMYGAESRVDALNTHADCPDDGKEECQVVEDYIKAAGKE